MVASTEPVRLSRRRAGAVLRAALVLALAGVFFLFAHAGAAQAAGVIYTNLRGVDRYDTAMKISRAMFPAGLPTGAGVVLAPGETFPEALCAAPLAAAYGGPVLLTPGMGLNNGIRDELLRLGPAQVICIGLSPGVVDQVQVALGPGVVVTAINGADVYDLSYEVAKALGAKVGDLSGATAVIARGDAFADVLGTSPLVCANRWPVLLTNGPTGALHASAVQALTELGISQAIKVGTYAVLPDWLTGLANLSGSDRYATNANVAEWAKDHGGAAFAHVGLATGDKFPDALAAGPYLAVEGGVLLLSPLSGLPAVIRAEFAANDPAVAHVSFVAMIRPVTSQVKSLLSDLAFDTTSAMAHLYQLSVVIGPRKGGSAAELAAAQYGVDYLTSLGYSPTLMDVPLPNGTTSHNVVAVKPGTSPLTIVVGGHMDSKVSTTVASPGGNDNASGSATVLELARALKDASLVPTVVFVLFGQEETVAGATDDHHWGSRRYVANMTAEQRADLVGMISVDMVGNGQFFYYRTMERGPARHARPHAGVCGRSAGQHLVPEGFIAQRIQRPRALRAFGLPGGLAGMAGRQGVSHRRRHLRTLQRGLRGEGRQVRARLPCRPRRERSLQPAGRQVLSRTGAAHRRYAFPRPQAGRELLPPAPCPRSQLGSASRGAVARRRGRQRRERQACRFRRCLPAER